MKGKEIISLSKFFIRESYGYIKPLKIRDILYFPIAYIKFIRLMEEDIKGGYDVNNCR